MNINDAFPSKWLKAADLKGHPPVSVVIREVTLEEVGDDKETKPVVYFEGKKLGVVLNKTNGAMIAHFYGSETDGWRGKQILLRCEPVAFAGKIVDSIRVSVDEATQYQAEQNATQANLEQELPPSTPQVAADPFDDDIPF